MAEEGSKQLHILPKDSVQLHELLSRGVSKVWRATYTGKLGQKFPVAAKKVPIGTSEVEIMQQINHKHIIKFYGVWKKNGQDVYIIMELAERGDLRHFLNECREKGRRLTIECIWKWTYEAACALHYLESIKHSHRNIMSVNFLIMEDYTLKLGELGLAIRLEATQMTEMKGACKWMAPEVILEQKRSPKSDLFSFAIVVWEIFTTDVPFKEYGNNFQVMNAVCKGARPQIPDECPEDLKSLMNRCWDGDRAKRPKIAEVCLELLPYQCKVSNFVESQDETDDGPRAELLLEEHIQDVSAGTPEKTSELSTPNVKDLTLQVQQQEGMASSATGSPTSGVQATPQYTRGTSHSSSSPTSPGTGASIESVLNSKYLLNLAKEMGNEWEHLGIYLDLEPNVVERIKNENKDNIEQAIFKMLIKWRQRQNPEIGLQSVVESLSKALSDCNREDLAHKVRLLLQVYCNVGDQ